MRIVIVGPGAMGCLVGAFLSKTKHELWILDKNKKRADYIAKNGIKIEGISGNWKAKIQATSDPKDIESVDLVIICTKSYDTKEAVGHAKNLIGETTLILTLQNGVGNVEIITEAIGEDRVVAGVSNLGATLLGDGHIRHAGRGETVIGKFDGKIPVLMRDIREAFNSAGLDMRISKDIKSLIWSKLIINVGINALTAITRLNNGRLIEFEGTREILKDAVTEAVKIAKRKKIKIIYDDPLSKVESVCEATAINVSSMLQDVLKEKRTEIDFINGVIVRQGKSLGIKTPVNEILVHLVKTIEQSYKLRVG
ncbi:MAG: 2-dehydropantoate 2-reductase [Candidatus Omnitrophica bacterium CG11_big_fil_rev_8_21_14_0_20_42_13]|uniref:2-dehydropantoate 2-reductase n=1 Tax=Candidatus Ghiorseimicrobium undicola TaxID=1974746 RepID=A0A2H0LZ72_9BACT|nr:MAG: 2-dehydropantoate 2-reductase [Candidatus Omnitrophica bacterium CG11_big_fil_rev_8_21_14_0_20_42_13]